MSAIEWTDETWNPTVGCSRVSPGCDNCYAEKVAARNLTAAHRGLTEGGKWTGEVRCLLERLATPLRWRKPRRVFVDSMSDLFHPDVPDEFIARVFGVCGAAERHTFQILTKRPQRMATLLSSPGFVREVQKRWWVKWYGVVDVPDPMPTRRAGDPESRPLRVDKSRARRLLWKPGRTSFPLGSQDLPFPLPNVWLGVSVENQTYADLRIPHLLATPAAVRFLSCEPLLGPVDLGQFLPLVNACQTNPTTPESAEAISAMIREASRALGPTIDWVIVGGESGPGARPMHPGWARSLRDQCVAAGVPFFFKQWGEWAPFAPTVENTRGGIEFLDLGDGDCLRRVGKKRAGRVLDGRTWDGTP